MALMFPSHFPRQRQGPRTETDRAAFEILRRQLDQSWWVFYGRTIVAGGESGQIDFILLHRERGIALLAAAADDEEIDLDDAEDAVRTMLREHGFATRFAGFLPLVGLSFAPDVGESIEDRLVCCFATEPPLAVDDPDWLEWVVDRLATPADLEPPAAPSPKARAGSTAGPLDGPATRLPPSRYRHPVLLGGAAVLLSAVAALVAMSWHGDAVEIPAASSAAVSAPPREDETPSWRELAAPTAPAPRGSAAVAAEPPPAPAARDSTAPVVTKAVREAAAKPVRSALRPVEAVSSQQRHSTSEPAPRPRNLPWWQRFQPVQPHLNERN